VSKIKKDTYHLFRILDKRRYLYTIQKSQFIFERGFINFLVNKYVRLRNTRTEMNTGRVACCPSVSHVEYAPMGQTDGQTDARQLHYAFR